MSAHSPTQTQASPVASFTREGTIILPDESGDQQEADAIFSTGSDVIRFDYATGEEFIERLRIDASSIRLERFQSGNSNVLDGHNSFGGVSAILGSVLSASVRNGQLVGTLKILHADTWRLLKGGAARALTVGYRVFRYEIQAATTESLQVREAVDWEPVELSVVPISADAGSAVTATRSVEPTPVGVNLMDQNVVTVDLETATRAARGAKMPNAEVLARSWVNAKLTATQAQNLALDFVAERIGDDGARPNIIPGEDLEARSRHDSMVTAVMHRIAPGKVELTDQSRTYRAMSMFELAKECAGPAARGLHDRGRIVDIALTRRGAGLMTTSDFPSILGDAAISVGSLGHGHSAMRRQVGLDGRKINVSPTSLIVPASLEIKARQQIAAVTADSPDNTNPFADFLSVIAEPRLDDDSETKWYLGASTDQVDIIELAQLEGEGGPMISTMIGFETSGIRFKIEYSVGAKVLDYRGLFRNNGS